ncbi:hypothetical protein AOLI_G00061180 [Acnodon oligacanthus]
MGASVSFHPESNGQTEQVNQDLACTLQCLTSIKPSSWTEHVPWAEYVHNTLWHSSLGMSPFECQFGFPPPMFTEEEHKVGVPAAEQFVQHCRRSWQKAHASLLTTTEARKQVADPKRRPAPTFQPGQRESNRQPVGNLQWANDLSSFFNRFDLVADPPTAQLAPLLSAPSIQPWAPLPLTREHVRRELRKMKVRKAAGPDNISPGILRHCADQLCGIVKDIFNLSLKTERVPVLGKTLCVVPIPKTAHPSGTDLASDEGSGKTCSCPSLSTDGTSYGSSAICLPARDWSGGWDNLPTPQIPRSS